MKGAGVDAGWALEACKDNRRGNRDNVLGIGGIVRCRKVMVIGKGGSAALAVN